MKFALLIYRDEKAAANVTPAEMQAEAQAEADDEVRRAFGLPMPQ